MRDSHEWATRSCVLEMHEFNAKHFRNARCGKHRTSPYQWVGSWTYAPKANESHAPRSQQDIQRATHTHVSNLHIPYSTYVCSKFVCQTHALMLRRVFCIISEYFGVFRRMCVCVCVCLNVYFMLMEWLMRLTPVQGFQ